MKCPFTRSRDGVFEVRWREGGRNKSLRVHGAYELARKIERKKMSVRDENRHLDIKREVNFRMSALIDRYWTHYGMQEAFGEPGEKHSGRHPSMSWARCSFGRLTARPLGAGTKTSPRFASCRRERPCGTSTSCTT